jgi:hypothetical protein
VPVGSEVALDINDAGRVALGGSMGPEIAQIEGRLVSKDSGEYVVAVSAVHILRGGADQVWRGEKVKIKPEFVSLAYEKKFSRGRSVALGAIGVGAAALLGSQAIIGSGTTDPGRTPGDTSQSTRRKP